MQIADILNRNKQSEASPEKFNFIFFIKDTWVKIVLSLLLSVCISVVVKLNLTDVHSAFSGDNLYGNLLYVVIGAVPEYALQVAKKKLGFTQPEKVKTKEKVFERK